METFTNEFNLRISQEMDSMMHSQTNRTKSSVFFDRVIPEISNIVSSMSSSGNEDTDAISSPNSQENRETNPGLKTKITKKTSRSDDQGAYMVTGATDTNGKLLNFLNRMANVLANLHKNQSMTIRPVITTPMTFDGKTEKFELFEDLSHTMIQMQPAMTEQMKINHFHSLLRKGALQTFSNINSINRQTLEEYWSYSGKTLSNRNS